jgi:hypothetical protein
MWFIFLLVFSKKIYKVMYVLHLTTYLLFLQELMSFINCPQLCYRVMYVFTVTYFIIDFSFFITGDFSFMIVYNHDFDIQYQFRSINNGPYFSPKEKGPYILFISISFLTLVIKFNLCIFLEKKLFV